MIRVFLVEDEPPALRKLKRLAAAESDLEVCGAAATCAEAVTGILETSPELLVLDIRLPDGMGFEIVQQVEAALDRPPHIVFITAYDEHAVRAFEIAALDYLLKPVSQERFSAAIRRVREAIAGKPPLIAPRYAKRFLVERLKAAYFLPVHSIRHITAERNYALLHTDIGEFALRTTMDALEKRLDPADFARISRGAIVRIAAVREVRLSDNQSHILILNTGEEIPCSRKFWSAALNHLL